MFQEIPGYKGASRWFSREGFFYTASRTRGATVSLKCATAPCPAHWILKNGEAGPIIGQHNHEPTPWILNRNNMFKTLKRRAAEETTPLNSIYLEELARYPDAAPHLLYESVVSTMRTCRRSTQPAIPRTIAAYGAALADHPVHGGMLLATLSAGGASAAILGMPGFGECLRDSTTIIVDGTFQTVPAGLAAAQLLTIHGVIGGSYFHPVLVLMGNRRRTLYEAVFRRVWHEAGNPHPQHVITDFEPALQSALEAVTRVQVQGCLFHFTQALLRRARQLGIQVRRGSPGWLLVQLHGALALLPPALVPVGLAEMPAIIAAEGLPVNQGFSDYFQAHWMARVGPTRFSVHRSPHLTTNVAESFHATLGRMLGAAPNVWRFTDVAAQLFGNSESRLHAFRRGHLRRRNIVKSYIRAAVISDNERSLNMGVISISQYLLAIAHNVNVGIEILNDDQIPDIAAEVVIDDQPLPEQGIVEDIEDILPEVVLNNPPRQLLAPEVVVDNEQQPLPEQEVVEVIEDILPEVVLNNPPRQPLAPEVVVDNEQQPLPEQEVVEVIEDILPEVVLNNPPRQPLAPEVVVDNEQADLPAPRCGICLENVVTRVMVPCGHALCADCLMHINNRDICPYCRARELLYFYNLFLISPGTDKQTDRQTDMFLMYTTVLPP